MSAGRFSRLEKDQPEEQVPELSPPPGTIPRGKPRGPASTEASYQAEEDVYAHFLELADEAFFTGSFRDALRFYSRALQETNNQVYPWIGQISALIELKQYKEAELWSNKALEQFPEDSSLLSQRARVLAATGNIKRAIGVSDYAMAKRATKWTWLARGEVLLEAKDGNALFCFEKAMEEAGPNDWRIPMLAGRAYSRRRQWATAEDFYRTAVERNSKNFFVWHEYAETLLEMNYTDRAQAAIERALQLKPNYQPSKNLLLKLYRRPFFKRVLGVFKR